MHGAFAQRSISTCATPLTSIANPRFKRQFGLHGDDTRGRSLRAAAQQRGAPRRGLSAQVVAELVKVFRENGADLNTARQRTLLPPPSSASSQSPQYLLERASDGSERSSTRC